MVTENRAGGKAASRKSLSQQSWGYVFALPAIVGFAVFTAWPMLYSLYLSFTSTRLGVSGDFIGLSNYRQIFSTDPFFKLSLRVTFYYLLLSVPVNIGASFAAALILSTKGLRGQRLFRTIVYLPYIVPAIANGLLWKWMFNPDFGLLNTMLRFFRLPTTQWVYAQSTVIPSLAFMQFWNIGGTMIIFLAGVQGVPASLYEAVVVDGGNFWHKFRHITVPMMTPTIFFNLVMAIISYLQAFYQAFVMTEGGPSNGSLFYAYHIYRTAFKDNSMGYASALAWILFVIVALFTVVLFKSSDRWVYYAQGEE
ncbi:MAG: sugar ABC transporter permease [Clostridiales bacterium]|jgi:multiple sugar transport system permease protein|nr:sugar ABC transporter permease [Clostridiales bacterium]